MLIGNTTRLSEFQEVLSVFRTNNSIKVIPNGITKSVRLDEDVIRKITEQAKNNNTSLNAEINRVLRKYIEWDMLASKTWMIPMARPVLYEIFQNIMTKQEVIDLANRIAKKAVREIAYFMKGGLTLKLFLLWLKTRMEYCSELNYAMENNNSDPQIRIIFKHDLGENWSIYHKIILDYIFEEMLMKDAVKIEVSTRSLILCFKQST
jgi:hypothetical protein